MVVKKFKGLEDKKKYYGVIGAPSSEEAILAVIRGRKENPKTCINYSTAHGVIGKYKGQEALFFEGDAKGKACTMVWHD